MSNVIPLDLFINIVRDDVTPRMDDYGRVLLIGALCSREPAADQCAAEAGDAQGGD